jgi:hypothetical protein
MVKGILRLRKNAHFVGVFAALRMTGRFRMIRLSLVPSTDIHHDPFFAKTI